MIFRWLTGLFLAALIGWVLALWVLPRWAPLPTRLVAEPDPTAILVDEEGHELRRVRVIGEEAWSEWTSWERIPSDMVNATVSAEDKRFWRHGGIDFLAMGRAVMDYQRLGYQVSGASTITQQLIKVTSHARPRNLRTKLIEMVCARKVELLYSKEWIFEGYINRLPYGNMRMGCTMAARGYFGKPLEDLSVAECAFLAALPNKPTRFNPYENFEGARERQLWILDRMLEDGYLTEEQWERAREEELVIVNERTAFRAPHAVDLILAKRRETVQEGGDIQTTLNLDLQAAVEDAVEDQLRRIDALRNTSPFLHAAVVVIENDTGAVRALVGSRNWFSPHAGQVNGAWAPRSPGSALKPFTYLMAMEGGMSPATILADTPATFMTPSGVYAPENYDRQFRGPVTMRHALGNSLNIPAIRVLDQAGGAAPLQETLTDLGLTTLTDDPERWGLGLTIGNAGARLLELTNAYATLARMGEWKPWRILSEEPAPEGVRVFSREKCWVLADMLSDPAARASTFGWKNSLTFDGFRVAAKTGTSTGYRDAWTMGFTPRYTVGVWVGNFDNSPLDHFTGAAGAGPIFHQVMEKLHADLEPEWYERPSGLMAIRMDPVTGHRLEGQEGVEEYVLEDELPPLAAAGDHDSRGRPLLPENYRDWLEEQPAGVRKRFAIRSVVAGQEFHITSPLPGMVIYLDPDVINGGRVLNLSTDSGRDIQWTSSTLTIQPGSSTVLLRPGDHELVAEDPGSGQRQAVRITVEQI